MTNFGRDGRSYKRSGYKKGGKVKKTGKALLHKGEQVVPAKKAKKMRKKGMFNAKKFEKAKKAHYGME